MPEPAEGHYCPECGAYSAHKPHVEFERDASTRSWEINIWTVDADNHERGMQIVVPDNPLAGWSLSPPQDLVNGTEFGPLRHEDEFKARNDG